MSRGEGAGGGKAWEDGLVEKVINKFDSEKKRKFFFSVIFNHPTTLSFLFQSYCLHWKANEKDRWPKNFYSCTGLIFISALLAE